MFGKNPIRSINHDPNYLALEEAFYTIQGEGPQSGRPALFIRLAGCNLACHFCDTQFETQADALRNVNDIADELMRRFTFKQRELVVMTGGEPMRQNWSLLATYLLATGTKMIQVETAGTLWQPDLDRMLSRIQFVCSPKTPRVHPRIADTCKHWKYIVRLGENHPSDGLPSRGTQLSTMDKTQHLYRADPSTTIWLSPCDEQDRLANQLNMELARDLCLRFGYRLSLQTHKIIGVA